MNPNESFLVPSLQEKKTSCPASLFCSVFCSLLGKTKQASEREVAASTFVVLLYIFFRAGALFS